ncbi:hypothetical protein M426DRAFT_21839 [Hypoxylon sp. CI-4A]|nr:hypothetical protein M426DRAFT_21839 [Hypoxylon sp. CI-4A]
MSQDSEPATPEGVVGCDPPETNDHGSSEAPAVDEGSDAGSDLYSSSSGSPEVHDNPEVEAPAADPGFRRERDLYSESDDDSEPNHVCNHLQLQYAQITGPEILAPDEIEFITNVDSVHLSSMNPHVFSRRVSYGRAFWAELRESHIAQIDETMDDFQGARSLGLITVNGIPIVVFIEALRCAKGLYLKFADPYTDGTEYEIKITERTGAVKVLLWAIYGLSDRVHFDHGKCTAEDYVEALYLAEKWDANGHVIREIGLLFKIFRLTSTAIWILNRHGDNEQFALLYKIQELYYRYRDLTLGYQHEPPSILAAWAVDVVEATCLERRLYSLTYDFRSEIHMARLQATIQAMALAIPQHVVDRDDPLYD